MILTNAPGNVGFGHMSNLIKGEPSLHFVRPYYLVPDGKVGHDAYAVIRETIRSLDKGCASTGRLDQPRTCYRPGGTRQWPDGNAAALPV
jgi:hypothetical protein